MGEATLTKKSMICVWEEVGEQVLGQREERRGATARAFLLKPEHSAPRWVDICMFPMH